MNRVWAKLSKAKRGGQFWILEKMLSKIEGFLEEGRSLVSPLTVHSTLLDYQIIQKIALTKSAQTFSDILDEFITH